jgi:hypothetical protein
MIHIIIRAAAADGATSGSFSIPNTVKRLLMFFTGYTLLLQMHREKGHKFYGYYTTHINITVNQIRKGCKLPWMDNHSQRR